MLLHARIIFLYLLVALVATGCGGDQNQSQHMAVVTYTEAKGEDVPIISEHSGRATALLVAEVRPQVGGIIQKQFFEEGSYVKAGQALYLIDPALYKAALDTAKANLARAEANAQAARLLAKRYAELVKSKAVSRQEYDNALAASNQAAAEVAAAKAAVDTASINLEYTNVYSPIDGIVGKSYVTPGALVAPGQPTALATVQNRDFMYVDIPRSGTDLLRLKKAEQAQTVSRAVVGGAKATLILPDGTEYPVPGELMFADVSVDPSTGSYITRAKFPNPDGVIMHNMFVRVRLEEGISRGAVVLPQCMITSNMHGQMYALVLAEAKPAPGEPLPQAPDPSMGVFMLETRPVQADRSKGNQWVVTGGLAPGDKVVVDGAAPIRDRSQPVFGKPVSLDAQNDKGNGQAADKAQGK